MRCFIHRDKEAIAACKRCGKAMCDDCSGYSGHSGVCPECRREDFIVEVNGKKKARKELYLERRSKEKNRIIYPVLAVLVLAAIIYFAFIQMGEVKFGLIAIAVEAIVVAIMMMTNEQNIKTVKDAEDALTERINLLTAEIERLTDVLDRTGSGVFI